MPGSAAPRAVPPRRGRDLYGHWLNAERHALAAETSWPSRRSSGRMDPLVGCGRRGEDRRLRAAARRRAVRSHATANNAAVTGDELARLAGRARDRRDRLGACGAVRGDRAADPRTARAGPLRRHALHDGAARGLLPSGVAAAGRAHRRLRGALLLRAGRPAGSGEGRLPRYTWYDAYAELREKLDALGRRLGGAYRVLVDANQHVDREGAARAGVGFYGKNTMLITRRHGSWVVLGTLVTDVELEPSPPLGLTAASAGSASTLARPARSTSRGRSTPLAVSPTGRRRRRRSRGVPRGARRDGLRLRHLPGRLSLEPRRREAPAR